MTILPRPTIPIESRDQHMAISGCSLIHRAKRERQETPPMSVGYFQVEVNFVAKLCSLSDAMWGNGGAAIGLVVLDA